MTLDEVIGYIQGLCDAKSESCPFDGICVIHNDMCYVVEGTNNG